MKKKIILSLVFVALISLIATVNCYATEEGGIYTDQGAFEYRIVDDYSVAITKYIGKNGRDITHIAIPSSVNDKPVRYIDTDTFKDVTGVTKITIPNTVQDISSYAFNNCVDLKTIEFGTNSDNAPSGGGYLHYASVNDCKDLNEIYVYNYMRSLSNSGVEHFGNPFYGCDNLKIIHGHKGSETEEYAQSNGLTFKPFTPFEDVNVDNWCYSAVKATYEKGIIKGLDSTHFGPYKNLSRGMLVTILWRMEGEPQTNSDRFPDVKSSDWYFQAVNWAKSNGVVNGYQTGNFGPKDDITREQLAAILMNYAKYKGYNTSAVVNTDKFSDFNETGKYFKDAVSWCVANKIITGKENGTKIDPKGKATRAEAASMIQRYCSKFGNF